MYCRPMPPVLYFLSTGGGIGTAKSRDFVLSSFSVGTCYQDCVRRYSIPTYQMIFHCRCEKINSSLFNEFACKLGFFGMSGPVLMAHECQKSSIYTRTS
jgi:hypothetical protein